MALAIEAVLPGLISALRARGCAVLEAPPGAGKTTAVPLALLAAGLSNQKILMLEPRRLAARTAAERMASVLGESVGERVGYRIRGESRVGKATRIEVVTEGVLTRMLQGDPALEGIGIVIFDEFHERSLQADLGLAMVAQVREILRDDLIVLVMSATLDGEGIASWLGDAPRITSEGRSFPVEAVWLDRPPDKSLPPGAALANLIREAFAPETGSLLAFLPGEGEIRRVAARLGDLPVQMLYGAMDFAAQRKVLREGQASRIILATSIAETSLTIDGVSTVVDGGLARRLLFDPASGMARLVTERVTGAEALQRQGRAGRLGPGKCYKLWTRGEEGGMAPYPQPEIRQGDLTALALELALWGDGGLDFLTPPDPARLAEARALLGGLEALDGTGKITEHGRAMAELPLHPRLAHMVLRAGKDAAPLASLLSERDFLREAGADLSLRLDAIARGDRRFPVIERIKSEATRIAKLAPVSTVAMSQAMMAALAFPDRIALAREADPTRYLLSGGKGARLDGPEFRGAAALVVTESDGDPREARIRTALALSADELKDLKRESRDRVDWNAREGRLRAVRAEMIGALVMSEKPLANPAQDLVIAALASGLRAIGLPHSKASLALQARVEFLRREDASWPDFSDQALLAGLEDWLGPHLIGSRSEADLRGLNLMQGLRSLLAGREHELEQLAPQSFTTPLGRAIEISYAGEHPEISLRLQEMFGVTRHPVVGRSHRPLRVSLLSPGGKPIQVTMDIPAFWKGSYQEVRKEMRGRYPRHPWPEDPTSADPTVRAKPRG